MWERACSRRRYVSHLDVECADAIASRLTPTVIRFERNSCVHRKFPVGASLLAKAVGQLASMLKVKPPSSECRPDQARSHSDPVVTQFLCSQKIPCGSGLARESGGSACIDVEG